MRLLFYKILIFLTFLPLGLLAQERVYLSTDKECYLAGESVWCSLYCMDEEMSYSQLSSVAYLDFCTNEGVVATVKMPLVEGRGCGKFDIPFSFATGNYSIIAYTKRYGGNTITPFNGKVVTIFNTLTNERVKGGVEVVAAQESAAAPVAEMGSTLQARSIVVEMSNSSYKRGDKFSMVLKNLRDKAASLSVSVYNLSGLENIIGENGYNSTRVVERTGDFEMREDVDYAGELIKVQLVDKRGGDNSKMKGTRLYISALNGDGDVYIAEADSMGVIKYHTNNIYGECDLIFDVAGSVDVAKSSSEESVIGKDLDIVIINEKYDHIPHTIPILKISEQMHDFLLKKSVDMQIVKRFERDTLYNLMSMRGNPLVGAVTPVVYALDDYTRFPVMEDVIREYVKRLRIRRFDKQVDLQISIETSVDNFNFTGGNALVLLDGVPVRDHKMIVGLDPLLVKEIIIYPAQIALNNFIYGGIVEFNTYKGDMGGLQLGSSVKIVPFDGVAYPLAFLGHKRADESDYPNYNSTIYWNPIVDIRANESLELEGFLPAYEGRFRIVVEGIDSAGNGIYHSQIFEVE